MTSDFKLRGEAFEEDLDPMAIVEVEPRYHPMVLHDSAVDMSWSPEAALLKTKVLTGQQPRFVRGGEGKAYGRGYLSKQFKSLDMSR